MKKFITAMSIVFITLLIVLIPTSSSANSSSASISGATTSKIDKNLISGGVVMVRKSTYWAYAYVRGAKSKIQNCFISGFKAELIYYKYDPSVTLCQTSSKKAYFKTVSRPYAKVKVVYKNKKVKESKGRVKKDQ